MYVHNLLLLLQFAICALSLEIRAWHLQYRIKLRRKVHYHPVSTIPPALLSVIPFYLLWLVSLAFFPHHHLPGKKIQFVVFANFFTLTISQLTYPENNLPCVYQRSEMCHCCHFLPVFLLLLQEKRT